MAGPVLSGALSSFRLPEVLTFLSTTRKSGTLTLAAGGREASLYFDGGSLVFAASNQEQFRLGSVLQRKKMITPEQRATIDELMHREGGRFGQLALQHGVVTDAQLRDSLKIQVSEIVFDAFVWEGGTFSFVEKADLPGYAVTISVDISNLIMEGARRIEEWEQCLKLLPDKSVVFRVVATPKDEKITLSADEWKILFLINGVRSLEELCHDAEDEAFQVYRVVYGLYANHLIEVAERRLTGDETTGRGPSHTTIPPDNGAVPMTSVGEDATVRQGSPRFSAESTVREAPDDTSLLLSDDKRLSYAEAVRPTIAQITITSGESAGQVIPLSEPEYLIGRHHDNSIHLTDPGVSGFHARIYRGPNGYNLEDLKSRNGTWINGNRTHHATLAHGDRIHVGQSDLMYQVLF